MPLQGSLDKSRWASDKTLEEPKMTPPPVPLRLSENNSGVSLFCPTGSNSSTQAFKVKMHQAAAACTEAKHA